MSIGEARPWLDQAQSDLRIARVLIDHPASLKDGDVGCHVVAMCAQVIEKSIKAYLVVIGIDFKSNHRPDKYIGPLLMGTGLRHSDDVKKLSRLFDPQTRSVVRGILDLTPGGKGTDFTIKNTEYPWKVNNRWCERPADSAHFGLEYARTAIKVATRVAEGLAKFASPAVVPP